MARYDCRNDLTQRTRPHARYAEPLACAKLPPPRPDGMGLPRGMIGFPLGGLASPTSAAFLSPAAHLSPQRRAIDCLSRREAISEWRLEDVNDSSCLRSCV